MDYLFYLIPLLSVVITFILTVIILKKLIPVLKSHHVGQKILEIGPRWHKGKEGTPTMGGLSFMLACAAVTVIFLIVLIILRCCGALEQVSIKAFIIMLSTLFLGFANGAVGIVDDKAKLKHKKNEGLTALQKYLLQFVIAVIYIAILAFGGCIDTSLALPFSHTLIDIGIFYYPLAVIFITGVVNSVNLTDGIDGLASSVTAVIGIFFLLIAFLQGNLLNSFPPALVLGSTLGFLVFNYYPARIFMGDTGSLFLGGLVVGISIACKAEIFFIIGGLLYFLEALSVIIQVLYFKATHGKRFFKMAPIHHHFEKCGWNERKIMFSFSAFTLIMCIIAYLGYIL